MAESSLSLNAGTKGRDILIPLGVVIVAVTAVFSSGKAVNELQHATAKLDEISIHIRDISKAITNHAERLATIETKLDIPKRNSRSEP